MPTFRASFCVWLISGLSVLAQAPTGHTYRFVSGSFYWETARDHAVSNGGYLATITSEAEWLEVMAVVNPSGTNNRAAFIGGRYQDFGGTGRWWWVTGPDVGQPMTLTNHWASGAPDPFGGCNFLIIHSYGWLDDVSEHYSAGITGYILEQDGAPHAVTPAPAAPMGVTTSRLGVIHSYGTSGGVCNNGHAILYRFAWGDATTSSFGAATQPHAWMTPGVFVVRAQACCQADNTVVSEWSSPTSVTVLPNDPQPPPGNSYTFVPGTFTWPTAKAHAVSNGGYLATIANEDEWLAVLVAAGSRAAFLGGADIVEEGVWRWETGPEAGQLMTYWDHWASGAPDNSGNSDCLIIIGSIGRMDDVPENYNIGITGYIKETDGAAHAVSPAPTRPGAPPLTRISSPQICGTGGSACNQTDHGVLYRFAWGDATTSSFSSAEQSHAWATSGVFAVSAQACCASDQTVVSGWSSPTNVTVLPNVTVVPDMTKWVNDGRPNTIDGWDRHEYFRGQDVYLPLTVNVDAPVATAGVHVALACNGVTLTTNTTRSLVLGANQISDLKWRVPADCPYGIYSIRAHIVNGAHILDTTQAGTNNADLGAPGAWLAGVEHAVHVCQGNPVILIHGIGDTPDRFGHMQRLLQDSNDFATVSFDYRGMTKGVANQASIRHVAAAFKGVDAPIFDGAAELPNSRIWINSVAYTRAYFGDRPKVDVIAHSMGGLVTRAYMAGIGINGASTVGYAEDIDKLITLGSPFYGWVDDIAHQFLNNVLFGEEGGSKRQLGEMSLGSSFLWDLTGASPYARHLAIAGQYLGATDDYSNDMCVPLTSAYAATLAASSRYLPGYSHGIFPEPIATVPDWPSCQEHDSFALIREFLTEQELSEGNTLDKLLLVSGPALMRTRTSAGDTVHARVVGTNRRNRLALTDPDKGLHANDRVNVLETAFTAIPLGRDSARFARAHILVSGFVAGHLLRRDVTMSETADSDQDGLTDDFEQTFWSDPRSAATGDIDSDGDDLTNLQEQFLGTDPKNKASHVSLESAPLEPVGGSGFRIPVQSCPDAWYQLQSASDLNSTWENVGAPVEGTGGTIVLSDPAALVRARLYRVKITLRP